VDEGVGRTQFGRLERKPGTLSTHTTVFLVSNMFLKYKCADLEMYSLMAKSATGIMGIGAMVDSQ
jgi:hypothetical protein